MVSIGFSDGQADFMSSLVELLEVSGVKDFTYGNNKELQNSLNKVEKADDPFFNRRQKSCRTCF